MIEDSAESLQRCRPRTLLAAPCQTHQNRSPAVQMLEERRNIIANEAGFDNGVRLPGGVGLRERAAVCSTAVVASS